jgi:AraC-like DNA-binding protein
MRFREVLPPEDLARTVACFWEFVAGPETPLGYIHTIPTDGCTSVSKPVGGGPPGLLGPRLDSWKMPLFPNTSYIGVRFAAGATRAALGLTGERLRDYVGLFEPLAPGCGVEYMAALRGIETLDEAVAPLTALVRTWVGRNGGRDEVVDAGVAALVHSRGDARISSIAKVVGLSERQFQRRFQVEVGLTPKQYARIVRLRAAAIDAAVLEGVSWAEVAADRGYADQAHLVREFAQILGMSPTEFKTAFAPAIEHVDVRS